MMMVRLQLECVDMMVRLQQSVCDSATDGEVTTECV